MPTQDFNVGRDAALTINHPTRGALRWKIRTSHEWTPVYKDVTSNGADGTDRFAYLPAGWRGSFKFDRADSSIDDFFVMMEDDYFRGIALQNATVTETITEVNGAISQYRYEGVALKLTGGGSWAGDNKVDQTVEGMAQRKKKIS